MKRVQPRELRSARVYFTELDRVTYSQVAWTPLDVEGIKKELVRKLKLLTLVKGHIVIAASHLLESELAREIILPHPQLFSEGIIVPALRAEFPTCNAFLEAKAQSKSSFEAKLYRGAEQRAMAELLDATATAVVWDTSETTDWFKTRLLSDLQAHDSVVGLLLQTKGLHAPQVMLDHIQDQPSISRGFVYAAVKDHDGLELQEVVCSYADFLYYLAGARAVAAEGILPQENIVDFSLFDLKENRTPFSESHVFFKIFIDLVKAATSTYFPNEFLDALTVEDAIDLHRVASSEGFIDKYNSIQEKTKAGLQITDPEQLVLLLEELEQFEHELKAQFETSITRELPSKFRQEESSRLGRFLHAMASLILSPYGTVAGVKDVVVSGLQVAEFDRIATAIENRIDSGIRALETFTQGIRGKSKPILLGFVDELKKRYVEKIL